MRPTHIAGAITCLFLEACSGNLYTVKEGVPEKGIYVFPQMNVIDVYEYTVLLDGDGKIKGTKNGDPSCTPKYEDKIVVRTDYNSAPMRIYYEPALLEQFKFAVTLKDGALESVNVDSAPDRGETLANLASAAKDAADVAKPTTAEPRECNASPRLYGTYKAPGVKEFSEKPKGGLRNAR